jgi:translation elongation factor EF-Ts
MLERIVTGKVSKRMAELCLVSQASALYVWLCW